MYPIVYTVYVLKKKNVKCRILAIFEISGNYTNKITERVALTGEQRGKVPIMHCITHQYTER